MSGRSPGAGSRKLFGLFGKRRKPVKTNSTLRFLHEVLRLEHLHYGLWEDEERDLAGLSQAQKRFCDELVSWVPEGVRSILDVGAGIGTTSQALSREGFEVEGLSLLGIKRSLVGTGQWMPQPYATNKTHTVKNQELVVGGYGSQV